MKQIITLLGFLLFVGNISLLRANDNPANADIVVASDGTGDFTTVQAAINAAPSNSDRRTVIYIKRGLYNAEKLIVPADKINLSLVGESREQTVLSYHIYDCSGGKCPAEDAAKWTGDNIRTSATLTIQGDGFRAENMTIQNTAGPVGQAQAVTVRADKCVFVNVDFYGYQDTLYFWSDGKRSYFQGCLVVGRTDYIYGGGIVYFQECEIRSWGGGWITAPSTSQKQDYGFVFNECAITYGLNSPGGSDGELVRLGRPWHNYPKVAWLNCEMTEMIHPQGWGDIWNMDYAPTSTDLHLYEYQNTGPGADMGQRADWAGLRAINDTEAENYTVQKVMAGSDGWDPTEEAQLVKNYEWNGGGTSNGWLLAENWTPAGMPEKGETATVDGDFTVIADGGTFPADLILKNKAKLKIAANSTATYISMVNAQIRTLANASLNGKITTKDSIYFVLENNLTLNSAMSGVHPLIKSGNGTLIFDADNSNFSGQIIVNSGTVSAPISGSFGKSAVLIENGAKLIVGNSNAFYAKAQLKIISGATLKLDADITTSEFFIDGEMQNVGEYSMATHPGLISGNGKIVVGRPEVFVFHRGSNGNWDVPENYTPALYPLAGEKVIVEEEMETTSTVFEAEVFLKGAGTLRLRGNHSATGTIHMASGTGFKYNTGGSGMLLDAPVSVEGDVSMVMESGNASGSAMTLAGPIAGHSKIIALNNGKGTVNTGTLLLTGDNSGFSGTWDLTQYSSKYPTTAGYISAIEGGSENAFGKGEIVAGHGNRVVFSHSKAAGDSLVLTLNESAKATLNADVVVRKYVLNGNSVGMGMYSASTNPELYEGEGKIIVGESDSIPEGNKPAAFPGAEGHGKDVTGGRGGRVIYVTNLEDNNSEGSLRYAVNQSGARIVVFKVSGNIQLKSKLTIRNNDITIAGQTAPGDGITLRDYAVGIDADNVIIRFMRFRMGDEKEQEDDALGGRFHKNIIIDHCSMSWSTDECVSFYVNENFTLQWSIISESLRNSVHNKGSHGYGGIWGGKNASFHHNLLAHHDSRNPRLGESAGTTYALTDLVDLRNNVIYNWQGNSCYGGEAMNVNIVNCYYKPGPATTKTERIVAIDKNKDAGSPIFGVWGKFYIDGNVLTGSARATEDNWTYGVYNQFHSSNGSVNQEQRDSIQISEPHNPGQVTTHSAEKAYEKILEFGGASLKRDAVDTRILHDLSTGTATYMNGGNGSKNGIIDTQSAVGGWPVLESLNAPADSDEDGMPDDWENANDLNPYDGGDAQLKSVDGVYPNIEVYINSLVSHIISVQNEEGISTAINQTNKLEPAEESIKMYFNNAEQNLVVSHRERINVVRIYGITGQLLTVNNFNDKEIRLDTSGLKRGIYIISVRDAKNKMFAKKVAKF
jgi:autotransporter-associated beta strand protein